MRTKGSYIKALREAGAVERAHTVPHSSSYNVAQHSYGVALLLVKLNPKTSRNLLLAALYHDLPERWLGDLPATLKRHAPAIAESYRALEQKVEERLELAVTLSPEEELWLKVMDVLEFVLWTEDEIAMGNTQVYGARKEAVGYLTSMRVCEPVTVALEVLRDYGETPRMNENIDEFIGEK